MKPIRTLVVDDEQPGRQAVKDLLREESAFEVVGEAGDGYEAVMQIRSLQPDLVFLDIQMPGRDGFEVIHEIGVGQMPMVVFVTAYSFHALNAFDVHAMDYVLKPIHPERFKVSLEKIRRLSASSQREQLNELIPFARQKYPKQFVIRSSGTIEIVKTDEIRWIEAQGDYVQFHTGRQKHLMRETLTRMAEYLDPAHFVRIHRSTIVRLGLIKELRPQFNGDYKVKLDDGTEVTLSRTYHEKVLKLLSSHP